MVENIKDSDIAYTCELGILADKAKSGNERAALLNMLVEENPHEAFKKAVVLIIRGEKDGVLVKEACRTIADCIEFGYATMPHDKRAANTALGSIRYSNLPREIKAWARLQWRRVNNYHVSGIKAVIPGVTPMPGARKPVAGNVRQLGPLHMF